MVVTTVTAPITSPAGSGNTGAAAENTVTYTNCTFPNGVCNNQYGKTVFNNCKFTNNTASLSNLWNYGGETKVEECTFTGIRGIKMYNEGTLQKSSVY